MTAPADFKIYITGIPAQHTTEPQLLDTSKIFMELLRNPQAEVDFSLPAAQMVAPSNYIQTRTACVPYIRVRPPHNLVWMQMKFLELKNSILEYANTNPEPISEQYDTFFIPKSSGGYREINAPKEQLKRMQYLLLEFIQNDLKVLAHNAAFAYIQRRSTVQALQQHQANDSHWFLKLDIKDFFPSCTHTFVCQQLKHIYPFCFFEPEELSIVLNIAMRNGAMPQGAPTSPCLSNLIMVPIDYEINKQLHNYNHHHFVYTRYADDILISCREAFNPEELTGVVSEILSPTPFRIKHEKTRYGSRAGRNWNLGLMLNKDNNITLGYKHKQRLRAAIFSLYKDHAAGVQWEPHDLAVLQGQISYMNAIDPTGAREMIQKYEEKFGLRLKDLLNN